MRSAPLTTFGQKTALIIFGLILSIVLLELGLRLGGFAFTFLQERYNSRLSRQKDSYIILCLGESTTAMGGKYSYPRQLEKILNEKHRELKFQVINKGLPAANSTTIIAQLEKNLRKYHPHLVITMMGINDTEDPSAYSAHAAPEKSPFWEEFRVYKLARLLREHIIYRMKKLTACRRKVIDEKATEIEPVDSGAYADSDLTQLAEVDNYEKITMLKEKIRLNPRPPWPYIMLGNLYRDNKKYEEAERLYKKAIRINPKYYQIYIELGKLYGLQEKWKEAENAYREVIKNDPNNDVAWKTLALCYGRQGKIKSVLKCIEKAELSQSTHLNQSTAENYHARRLPCPLSNQSDKSRVSADLAQKTASTQAMCNPHASQHCARA